MTSTLIGKIGWAILLGLLVFGMISAFQVLDKEQLKEQWKDNPKATGFQFLAFSQGLGSSTPVFCLIENEEVCKLEVPYPDNTDLIGLFIAALLAIGVIRMTGIKNSYLFSALLFVIFLMAGWVLWKVLMYYAYYWGAAKIGLSYVEASQVRQNVIVQGGKIGIPLLVLTLFTFIAGLKLLPRKWN